MKEKGNKDRCHEHLGYYNSRFSLLNGVSPIKERLWYFKECRSMVRF